MGLARPSACFPPPLSDSPPVSHHARPSPACGTTGCPSCGFGVWLGSLRLVPGPRGRRPLGLWVRCSAPWARSARLPGSAGQVSLELSREVAPMPQTGMLAHDEGRPRHGGGCSCLQGQHVPSPVGHPQGKSNHSRKAAPASGVVAVRRRLQAERPRRVCSVSSRTSGAGAGDVSPCPRVFRPVVASAEVRSTAVLSRHAARPVSGLAWSAAPARPGLSRDGDGTGQRHPLPGALRVHSWAPTPVCGFRVPSGGCSVHGERSRPPHRLQTSLRSWRSPSQRRVPGPGRRSAAPGPSPVPQAAALLGVRPCGGRASRHRPCTACRLSPVFLPGRPLAVVGSS